MTISKKIMAGADPITLAQISQWAKDGVLETKSIQGIAYDSETNPKLPTLILLVGIPGSGKSSYAKTLSQEKGVQVISTDVERLALLKPDATTKDKQTRLSRLDNGFERSMIFNGQDLKGTPRGDGKLGINLRIVKQLSSKVSVVYDATNLNPKTRQELYKQLKAANWGVGVACNIELRIFHVSRETASQRIAADMKANKIRANVPTEGINRTWEAYSKMMKDLEAEVQKFTISHVEFH